MANVAQDDTDEKDKYAKGAVKLQKAWKKEINAAEKRLEDFIKVGTQVNDRFLGKKGSTDKLSGVSRLNLFNSNTTTTLSMLYGNIPKIDVSRTFTDAKDDEARIASEMMERLLNADVQENGSEIDTVLRSVLQDRLLSGLGCARVRYEAVFGADDEVDQEFAHTDYYYWKDVRWGWGRSFKSLPWIAFRNFLTKAEATKRFGKAKAETLSYEKQKIAEEGDKSGNQGTDVTAKAEIWEIWHKGTKRVLWYSEECTKILDVKQDPLGLKGFFPCPPFFAANVTTTEYMPMADFKLSEDLYNEIDILQSRINKITEALKVVGVYDQKQTEVKKMLDSGSDNTLIAVEKWAMLSERGGLDKVIDWYPVKEVAETLSEIIKLRNDAIGLLQQVTGMSDVMRGQLDNQYEGTGQTKEKAKFGSVRIQALQDSFARFATDLMQLKADVIIGHFSPANIVKGANMQNSMDVDKLPAAMELLQSPDAAIRINIRPESVAMVDYAQLQAERTGFLNAMATFIQSATPMLEKEPTTAPFMMQMLQWGMAGFKGASEIEGVMDRAIEATIEAQKNAQDKPDPEAAKGQAKMAEIQAKAQADMKVREHDLQSDIKLIEVQTQADLQKVNADTSGDLAEIQAKTEAKIVEITTAAQAKMEEGINQINQDVEKRLAELQISLTEIAEKSKIEVDAEKQKAKIPKPEPKKDKSND